MEKRRGALNKVGYIHLCKYVSLVMVGTQLGLLRGGAREPGQWQIVPAQSRPWQRQALIQNAQPALIKRGWLGRLGKQQESTGAAW